VGIRIALLGQPLVVSDDGLREFALPRKTLHVLAYLILNRRRPTTRDTVAFALFPDDEEEATRNALRRNLSYLLGALPDGRQFIDADADRIAWRPDAPAHVDVIAFEEAIRAGHDADALAQYAGQLLPTIYDDWTTSDRERLRDAYHEVLSRSIAAQRSLRQYDGATATAHRLLTDDPWREDIVRQLMAIRYEAGDRAGALAAFDRFATLLRSEMQTEPMPETFALRDTVLRGARLATSEARRTAVAAPLNADAALPLVGRDAVMKQAHAAWQSAADGRASVLFVSGEAGVGKSRFATELVRMAEREGGFIVRGHTSAGGEQRPYESFMEALHGAPALLDEQTGAAVTDERSGRLRLFDTVRRHLGDLSRTRPMVLVLEDLHWAGAPTIDLLDLVARRLGESPVLIVATARSDDLTRAHPLRALRRELLRAGLAKEIVLDRLNAEDAMRAARAALPASVADETLAHALGWVDGVPLLLVEAVRDLAAGRTSGAESMTALVAERFERLSSDAETTLIFGAVLGERFDLGTLVAATGWRDDQVLDAIGESIDCGFVRAAAKTHGLAFAFTHDLIRVAATERISKSDLTRAHGLVARAICAQADTDRPRAREIALHFAAAGENTRAAGYFQTAAQYALDVFANQDARESAAAGLALCDDADPAQRALRYDLLAVRERSLARIGATDERRADAQLLVMLAGGDDATVVALDRLFEAFATDAPGRRDALARLEALTGTSPLAERTHAYAAARNAYLDGEYVRARAAALSAADAFERVDDQPAAIRARFIGISSLTRLGSFAECTAELERLRPAMDTSADLVLRWEFHLVAAAALGETQREAALADARRSLALALRIGDRFAEARAHHNVGALASKIGLYDEALAEHEQALAAYRDVGDAPGIRDALLNLVSVRIFCGDYERTRQLLDEVDQEETPWLALRCTIIRGVLAHRSAQPADAERYYLDAHRRAEELGATLYRARSGVELANLLLAQGRASEAAAYLNASLETFATMGGPDVEIEALALSAHIQAMLGDAHGARERAQQVAERCAGKRLQSASEIAWNLAAAYAQIGDHDRAFQFAGEASATAVRDALGMPPDLAESYLGLPWHQRALDYLWGESPFINKSHTSSKAVSIAGSRQSR
jgi:DNA-binding SARP family transcriptional activator/tetratricopeptide (TPR) repeat protein